MPCRKTWAKPGRRCDPLALSDNALIFCGTAAVSFFWPIRSPSRVSATSLHWTSDDGKTWQGPVQIDSVGGAYPSMVELPNGQVYCVYYEEGKGSSIQACG